MNWIIATLNNCSMRNSECLLMNESCEDWLKSLRPQNHWNPSEEQMEYLKRAVNAQSYDNTVLEELYNELKKLIE